MLGLGLSGLGVCPVLEHLLEGQVHGGGLPVVGLLPLLQSPDLTGQALIFLADGLHEGFLFLPVPFHGALQILQVLHVGLGRGLLRRQGRFLCPKLRHVGGDGVGGLGRLALAALQKGQLLADSGQVLFIDLDLGLLGR